MSSQKETRTTRRRVRQTALSSIFLTIAITVGFSAASSAQDSVGLPEDQRLEIPSEDPTEDGFGYSVAVDGDTMVVGAPDFGENGAVFVFENTAEGWVAQQQLTAESVVSDGLIFDLSIGDQFGHSVAIDGDTIVVGAPTGVPSFVPLEDEFPSFVPPEGPVLILPPEDLVISPLGVAVAPVASSAPGVAYAFEFDGTQWNEEQQLNASDFFSLDGEFFVPGEGFGNSVAIDGDTIVVGEPFNTACDLDFGILRPISCGGEGGAYVYERAEETWQGQQRLAPELFSGVSDDLFGYSVAIDGDTIVIGAPFGQEIDERFLAFGIVFDPGSFANGVAHVFAFDGDEWNETQRLAGDNEVNDEVILDGRLGFLEADTADQFGYSVAIDANTIVVGALLENGQSFDEGAAYVFANEGDSWVEEATLTPIDAEPDARFSRSISIEGDTIVAGAPFNGPLAGAAWVFGNVDDDWVEQEQLVPSDIEPGEGFGFSIDLSNDTVVVGAPLNLTVLGPILGDEVPLNNGQGAAYVFDLSTEEEVPDEEEEEAPEEEEEVTDPPVDQPLLFCNSQPVTVNLALGDVPTDGDDVILGTEGPDVINALDGNDTICGEGGADTINAGDGRDTVFGGSGADVINAGGGRDMVFAQGGDDFVSGGRGQDMLLGGRGDDDLRGNEGSDTILGGSGNDELRGGQRIDVLSGGNGNDALFGGIRGDQLDGGTGLDSYNGGAGTDTCLADPVGRTEITANCER